MTNVREELASLIGSCFRGVWGAVHIEHQRVVDEPAIAVWLAFEGQPLRGFKGASNGEGILMINEAPRPQDMGEAGEVIIRDLTGRSPFARAVGKPVLAIWELSSTQTEITSGFRFDFGGIVKPIILNWGDEILIRMSLPADLGEDEITEALLAGTGGSPRA